MKILYICTHNRCRSILSEAITNDLAGDVITAKSAGSAPAGEVHPLTLKYLAQSGYKTAHLRSQSWDDFADFAPDVVVTLCDSAAGESCPVYFGKSIKLHWGLNDPSKNTDSDAATEQAFLQCISVIEKRVAALKAIVELGAQGEDFVSQLRQIGEIV
ncbi:arsenate reductase ArsC [Ostreibacterium oceani]|uniref:Arsenate reductase ArsC n=1 Tax=Ostreibacterium oceani TaxID=2654998 RepID=A0A6N7EX81_9GAMM|nr:arsenate reductase ArsC [Ostreibacterium oceani]MPV86150.1 arsenate reductase ArsC [Ostreibacterium oceani]